MATAFPPQHGSPKQCQTLTLPLLAPAKTLMLPRLALCFLVFGFAPLFLRSPHPLRKWPRARDCLTYLVPRADFGNCSCLLYIYKHTLLVHYLAGGIRNLL